MRKLLISFAVVCFASAAFAQGRPAGVGTAFVGTEEMSETVSVFGQVVAGRESAVAARVAGIALDVPLMVGDRVSAGDVLARLDTERLEIELSQAEAEMAIAVAGVSVAEARLEKAEKALRRAESLAANATIADATVEDREGDFAEAQGNLAQAAARITAAEAALDRAQYNLDNLTIRSPFDGIVLEVATQVGQFVSAGSTVARLVDLSGLEVEANVPSRYIDALQPDLPVTARTDAGGALTLSLRAIVPTEFAQTRTRPVRLGIEGEDSGAAVGQAVTLDVPVSAPREVLVVPKDALIQARGGWSVFLHVDGKAVPSPVEIGSAVGEGFEVISGLEQGAEVVVRGNERLRPGQDITPMPGGPPAGEREGTARVAPADNASERG
ncbi:MAG: efflux RND transporter periplasmic adaptor subunit [Paracoccaceae bacterium]|nr:efflux RND transporter periplasmic adaptor subunit [Paracoccaceae bacterium]